MYVGIWRVRPKECLIPLKHLTSLKSPSKFVQTYFVVLHRDHVTLSLSLYTA